MRKERVVNFCAGMMVGMLIVAVAVEVIVWWRQQGERYGLSKPVQVVPVVYRQDRPAIRQAEIERRRERFAEVGVRIDINRVAEIESSGDPSATGVAGERGLCQLMPGTWADVTTEMGVEWDFDEAFDPRKNLAVADWYLARTIPRYLKYYGIPDTTSARMAAYNYGIGNIKRLHGEHGGYWLMHTPECVQEYVLKYHKAEPQRDYVATYKAERPR